MKLTNRIALGACWLASLLLLLPQAVDAQYLTRPTIPWETLTTTSFEVHYPAAMRTWVRPVVERLEQYAAAVNDLVGSRPSHRVTVMVEDPLNVANGFAVPLLDGPTIFLWPTPPTPGPTLGAFRDWGEILAIHEYAHIAHLTIPSRNGMDRLIWKLAPAELGPVARRVPPWVYEGYATVVEGRLTGGGRPSSNGRATVLRQWALEGQLPKYHELNSAQPYLGGSMRYLAGSAFLEWLVERKGEGSLRDLWRRLSARQRRSFDDAFRGVYGAGPEELYGTFYTEVIERALTVKRALTQAGLQEGTLQQRMRWSTGDPAVSRDGAHVAVVVRSRSGPSRLQIWRTSEVPDSSRAWAQRRLVERDPLDVAAVDSFPVPRRAVATLHPRRGRSHENPRWFADGERVLVSRDEPTGDGAVRPDLFIWNRRSGGLRRVTRGAGIRGADPSPGGQAAAGVRCDNGICDLVRIDLQRGAISVIAAGSPSVVWHRARYSPDGTRIAASVHRNGRWQVAVVDATNGSEVRVAVADTAARYTPSWTPDGQLVVVSEASGIANLERIDLGTGRTQQLTRVTGAASAPDVAPDGSIWYLALHARGQDVRVMPTTAAAMSFVALSPSLRPVVPAPVLSGRSFAPTQLPAASDYALGPRRFRLLPGGTSGPDGSFATLMLASIDPVARWSTVLLGVHGGRETWRGGALQTAMRTTAFEIRGSAWYADHQPSRQDSENLAPMDIDGRYTGGGISLLRAHEGSLLGWRIGAGGSIGTISGTQLDGASRVLGAGDARVRITLPFRGATLSPVVGAHYAAGSTKGESWTRQIVNASVTLGSGARSLRLEGWRGNVTAPEPGEFGRAWEQFSLGGTASPLIEDQWIRQRVSVPSVPVGYGSGSRFELFEASTNVLGIRPYAIWSWAGDSLTRYRRLVGAEYRFSTEAIGFARLPAVDIRGGLGYSLDAPFDDRVRPYVSVRFRP